ncbi:MAG: divergent polysaccharide deacetylase family protein [Mariprofundaceae bacterium]|nr:divergent polysaccharide deacetylase family protein [Mariprofundaceae bacterium]
MLFRTWRNTKKRRESVAMNFRVRPTWVYAVLSVLLAALLFAVWLGSDSVQKKDDESKSTVPQVVFEDTERMASIKVAEPKRKLTEPDVPGRHGIAVILDDVGYDLKALRRALAFSWPLAISILPDAPHARKAAILAHEAGHAVMLHMPMEPLNPRYQKQMDESFIRVGMKRDEVRQLMLNALIRIPFVEGVNNHMGSRLSALPAPMRWVMQVCREQKLFFVDSRTNKDSVAAQLAREAGIRWGERRVFLDDSVEPEKLRQSWRLARKRLAKNGFVIVIAHPHKQSLDFLAQLSDADKAVIVPLQRLLFAAEKPVVGEHSTASRR